MKDKHRQIIVSRSKMAQAGVSYVATGKPSTGEVEPHAQTKAELRQIEDHLHDPTQLKPWHHQAKLSLSSQDGKAYAKLSHT